MAPCQSFIVSSPFWQDWPACVSRQRSRLLSRTKLWAERNRTSDQKGMFSFVPQPSVLRKRAATPVLAESAASAHRHHHTFPPFMSDGQYDGWKCRKPPLCDCWHTSPKTTSARALYAIGKKLHDRERLSPVGRSRRISW